MLRPILKFAFIPVVGFAAFFVARAIGEGYTFGASVHSFVLLGSLVLLYVSNAVKNITISALSSFAVAVIGMMIMREASGSLGSAADYFGGNNPAASMMLFASTAIVGGVVVVLMRASDVIDKCFGVKFIDDRSA